MLKKILFCLTCFYRRALPPYKWRCYCRFYPTCSRYALEAVGKCGTWKDGKLALFRILRCNPFSKGEYDPAP